MIDTPHKRFLACCACGSMTPAVLPDPSDPQELTAAYLQDWYEFFASHAEHGLTEMSRPLDGGMRGGPLWDPMAPILFEVVGGGRTHLVRASRAAIEAPRHYALLPGALRLDPGTVEVDDADVRRALDMELGTEVVRAAQIEAFLDAVHASLDDIAVADVEIAFEDIDDPEIGVAALPDPALRRLLEALPAIFDDRARGRVERFLIENRGEDGLLALRVRRRAVPVLA